MADSTLMIVPDDVTDEEALLLGDIFSTGYFCADNAGIAAAVAGNQNQRDSEEDRLSVAVVGCGPVGIMAIIGAY